MVYIEFCTYRALITALQHQNVRAHLVYVVHESQSKEVKIKVQYFFTEKRLYIEGVTNINI